VILYFINVFNGQGKRLLNIMRMLATVAGRAIGFVLEQPLHVVAFACSASGISKQIDYIGCRIRYTKKFPIKTF
jgi:hypothetical protein